MPQLRLTGRNLGNMGGLFAAWILILAHGEERLALCAFSHHPSLTPK